MNGPRDITRTYRQKSSDGYSNAGETAGGGTVAAARALLQVPISDAVRGRPPATGEIIRSREIVRHRRHHVTRTSLSPQWPGGRNPGRRAAAVVS